MLGFWRLHCDYQQLARRKLSKIAKTNPESVLEYQTEITKLYIFDLDPLYDVISHLYSNTPRKNIAKNLCKCVR